MSEKKQFFTSHAKSSAALVSVAVHALLIVVALSFVAVTVITKEEKSFDAKPVSRPQMQLKKLQVPVNIKKKRVQKPKLRKRIVVQPKMNQTMPDIKMPEITGVKGGMGSAAGSGLGGAGGVGFFMPEIDVFGIKSRGEKVFIILDASPEMMYDEMGGIQAYTIIKEELVRIVDELPPTTLFNVVVYDSGRTYMLFSSMVSANSSNVAKVDQWLKPLNSIRPGMGSNEWGGSTLGPEGQENSDDFRIGKFERQELWYRPAMLAMKQQADAVFVLTSWWGHQRIPKTEIDKDWYNSSAGRRWKESHEEAKKLLDEDNKKRVANGEPPRVIRRDNPWDMNRAYFPDIERPPDPEFYYHTPREFAEGFMAVREQFKPKEIQSRSGIKNKKKRKEISFSFNAVHFTKADAEWSEWRDGRTEENFKKLTGLCKGDYRTLAGLEAIKSSVQ
jgi:hypothetical protein